jgi:hypothetical protein
MENLILAQTSPTGPVPRARPLPLTGGPRLSAPARAHALFLLSLSRCPVRPTCRRRSVRARARSLPLPGGPLLSTLTARSRVLSLCPWTPPVSPLLFPNLSPAPSVVDAPTTTRFPATTLAPEPFSTAHAHSLTPLAQLRPSRPPSRSLALRAPRKFRRRSPWSRAHSAIAVESPSCPLPR